MRYPSQGILPHTKKKKKIQTLTDGEKDILAYYIHNQKRSEYLPYNDELVRELQRLRIIDQSSIVSSCL
ncbi:super-infection exclusion protein B [Peribacillus frigoritolerans]